MTRGAGASIQGTPPQDDRRQRGDSPSPPVCAPAVPPSARVAGAVTRPGASRRSASSRKPRFSVTPRGRGASPAALLLGNGVEKGPEQAPGRNLSRAKPEPRDARGEFWKSTSRPSGPAAPGPPRLPCARRAGTGRDGALSTRTDDEHPRVTRGSASCPDPRRGPREPAATGRGACGMFQTRRPRHRATHPRGRLGPTPLRSPLPSRPPGPGPQQTPRGGDVTAWESRGRARLPHAP